METKMIGGKIAEARKKRIFRRRSWRNNFSSARRPSGNGSGESRFRILLPVFRLAEIFGVDLNYFSENFPSVTDEHRPVNETPEEQATVSPAGTPKSKTAWNMSNGNWVDADFSGLKNLQEKFSSSNMQRCQFIGSDLSGLLLKNNNVDRCDFSGSDFSKSMVQGSNLSGNDFKECVLKDAEFSGSYIGNCDFTGADLTGTVLKSGGIEKSKLTNAVLKGTSFQNAHVADLVFNGTLEDCSFENCAFSRVTFQDAKLLNTFFKCRSLKKIKFVNCQADRMTYAFLKNGKADLSGITLIED